MKRLHQVFATPALIATVSGFGLVSALVGDGVWDVLSWLCLGLGVAVAVRYGMPVSRRLRHNQPPLASATPPDPSLNQAPLP